MVEWLNFPCPNYMLNLNNQNYLPDRKPIIEIAEMLPLQQSQYINQSKTSIY